MHISMGLPTLFPHGRDVELAWYRKIDEGPWNGLVTYERLLYPDSWAVVPQLAAAAAVTERVRLWTDVVALPLRDPVLFAKDLATVDVLSGGRLTLGVGIGAWDEDYRAVGSPLERKRQRMDAAVTAMRRVWAPEPPVDGHLPVGPAPVQAAIPLVAGVVGPKALARAARWAAGVSDPAHSLHFDTEALAAQRERVIEAWRAAGRTERPHFSAPIWFALGPDPETQLREHVRDFWDQDLTLTGTASSYVTDPDAGFLNCGASALRAAVDGAREAGLDELRLIPTTADPDEIDRAREVLGM